MAAPNGRTHRVFAGMVGGQEGDRGRSGQTFGHFLAELWVDFVTSFPAQFIDPPPGALLA
jgi:hypothetical protein